MDLLTQTEACKLVGVSDRTLRKWTATGRLTRHSGTDGRPRYSRVELVTVRGDQPELFRNAPELTGTQPEELRNQPEPTGTNRNSLQPGDWRKMWHQANEDNARFSGENASLRRQVTELQAEVLQLTRLGIAAAEEVGWLKAAAEERDHLRQQLQQEREQREVSEAQWRVLVQQKVPDRQVKALPETSSPRIWWRWW